MGWDGRRGDTGRSLRQDQVHRVVVCQDLGDTWGAGVVGSHRSQCWLGGCWGPLSSGDLTRVLRPSGWGCPPSEPGAEVFPTSHVTSVPPGTVGDSGWPSRQRAFGEEMPLEQLHTSAAGHTTSPYQGHALPAAFLPASELLQEERDDLALIYPCCKEPCVSPHSPEPAWIQGGGTLAPCIPCASLAAPVLTRCVRVRGDPLRDANFSNTLPAHWTLSGTWADPGSALFWVLLGSPGLAPLPRLPGQREGKGLQHTRAVPAPSPLALGSTR